MEADAWSVRFASKRHQLALQSRSAVDADLHFGFEEIDGDDDSRAEFPCPFCSEDFDMLGLCCHIDDEHPVEAKNGVCPVCAARVGMDMVRHITMQHRHFFKMQQKRKSHKGLAGSHRSHTFSLLRKELREGHIQSFLGGSSCMVSSNTAPDPLLSSFIYSLPMADASKSVQPHTSDERRSVKKSLNEKVGERPSGTSVEPSLSDEDQKKEAQKCEFIQQLFLSTFLDDIL